MSLYVELDTVGTGCKYRKSRKVLREAEFSIALS
jgi:hypothetical protein